MRVTAFIMNRRISSLFSVRFRARAPIIACHSSLAFLVESWWVPTMQWEHTLVLLQLGSLWSHAYVSTRMLWPLCNVACLLAFDCLRRLCGTLSGSFHFIGKETSRLNNENFCFADLTVVGARFSPFLCSIPNLFVWLKWVHVMACKMSQKLSQRAWK
jgi:hypothetical protein